MNWRTLPLGPELLSGHRPRRQANKYEYDKSLHVVRLDRPLYASWNFVELGLPMIKQVSICNYSLDLRPE